MAELCLDGIPIEFFYEGNQDIIREAVDSSGDGCMSREEADSYVHSKRPVRIVKRELKSESTQNTFEMVDCFAKRGKYQDEATRLEAIQMWEEEFMSCSRPIILFRDKHSPSPQGYYPRVDCGLFSPPRIGFQSLVCNSDERFLQYLEMALREETKSIRLAILEGFDWRAHERYEPEISQHGFNMNMETILSLLEDPDEDIQIAAAECLMRKDLVYINDILAALKDHPSEDVRDEVAGYCGRYLFGYMMEDIPPVGDGPYVGPPVLFKVPIAATPRSEEQKVMDALLDFLKADPSRKVRLTVLDVLDRASRLWSFISNGTERYYYKEHFNSMTNNGQRVITALREAQQSEDDPEILAKIPVLIEQYERKDPFEE